MKRFLNLVVYILTIHVSALLIAGLFRLVLFISSYHQLTSEALSDKTLPMLAFVHGVWFDNIRLYLRLPFRDYARYCL